MRLVFHPVCARLQYLVRGREHEEVRRLWFLIPFRDLWATAVWAAGLFGHTVQWHEFRLTLDRTDRIVNAEVIAPKIRVHQRQRAANMGSEST